MLLSNYEVFCSRSPEQVIQELSSKYCSHSMMLQSNVRSMDAQLNRVSFGSSSFNFLSYGASVEVSPQPFKNFIMLELPVSGCSEIRYSGETVASKGHHAAVVSSGYKPFSRWDKDTSRLMVQLDYATVERVLCDLLGHGITERIEFSLDLNTSTYLGKGVRDYVFYVANQINDNTYFQKNRLVRREMEQFLILMLLNAQKNNYSEQIAAKTVPGKPKYINRAYEYIQDNFSQDLTIDDLIRVSGVSARTLYAGFRRYVGISPMMAIRAARLNAVRATLLDNSDNDSITRIAGMYGFVHMGNFSKYYYRQFGETPSQTAKRNR